MHIQVHTDSNIQSRAGLTDHVHEVARHALDHMSAQITRVEVHLSDESGHKHGHDDSRCMMEARLGGRHPTAVVHHAPTLHQAIGGAAEKLKRAVEHSIGKLENRRG